MAMPQRDNVIEEIKRLDALLNTPPCHSRIYINPGMA